MGKVIYDLSMSLDGFIAGANMRPEAGLGDGGEVLHEWAALPDPYTDSIMASYQVCQPSALLIPSVLGLAHLVGFLGKLAKCELLYPASA